jgi:hypothetical protein
MVTHRVIPLVLLMAFAQSMVPAPAFLPLSIELTCQTNGHVPSVVSLQLLLLFVEGLSPFGQERNCCHPQIQILITHLLYGGLEAVEAPVKIVLDGCSWFMYLVYHLFV